MNQDAIGNRLLRALPAEEWERIEPHLEPVDWPLGTLLQEDGTSVEHAAFPCDGLLSAVLRSSQNVCVEIGITGNIGVCGADAILAGEPAIAQTTVQVPGHGLLLPSDILCREWERGETLARLLTIHSHVATAQTTHCVLCNRLHTVEERLSRWLLMVQDCLENDTFEIADPFIAALLGMRLTGVPVALGALQQAGMIQRTNRGIVILDRAALEHSACECYGLLRARLEGWSHVLSDSLQAA